MDISKINIENPESKVIERAVEIILSGGSVVLPTDTAYGLAVNAQDRRAVKKLFEIKSRPKTSPIPIAVSGLEQAYRLAFFNKQALILAKKFWPGALTLVLPKKKIVPDEVAGFGSTIGLRIPDSRICFALARKLQVPYTITSANLSGGETPYSASMIFKEFHKRRLKPDLVLDGGNLPQREASTVVDLSNNKIKVLRKGPVKIEF